MEWISCIHNTIRYIEAHIRDEDCAEQVLKRSVISPVLLQKGFQVLTGDTITTYIRNRRLYLAALELKNTERRIIDIALDAGFETPESFTKAFTRFHGCNPTQARNGAAIQVFLPLRISVCVQGGDQIACRVKQLPAIRIMGYVRVMQSENAKKSIPDFWDEVLKKDQGGFEYAVCMDDIDEHSFHYMIGRCYTGGAVPEGMQLYELPAREWAVFECQGENPAAIQNLDERIWKEWLPGNPDYERDGNADIEWYGDHLRSEIWLPVRHCNS